MENVRANIPDYHQFSGSQPPLEEQQRRLYADLDLAAAPVDPNDEQVRWKSSYIPVTSYHQVNH